MVTGPRRTHGLRESSLIMVNSDKKSYVGRNGPEGTLT